MKYTMLIGGAVVALLGYRLMVSKQPQVTVESSTPLVTPPQIKIPDVPSPVIPANTNLVNITKLQNKLTETVATITANTSLAINKLTAATTDKATASGTQIAALGQILKGGVLGLNSGLNFKYDAAGRILNVDRRQLPSLPSGVSQVVTSRGLETFGNNPRDIARAQRQQRIDDRNEAIRNRNLRLVNV